MDDLFDEESGIFANAKNDGREWERSCSLEMISPDGESGFQENCGVRIRGIPAGCPPMPSMHFVSFRSEYGPAKLKYPVFGKDAAQEFDNIDLRIVQQLLVEPKR